MGSKVRVLHIIPGFGGGISSHVRNIINGINKDEVTIDVAGFTVVYTVLFMLISFVFYRKLVFSSIGKFSRKVAI